MKSKEEIIDILLNQLKFERYPPPISSGGQSCGMPRQGVKLSCSETDFSITITWYRSQLQNKQMAVDLYKQFLEKVID